VAGVEQGSPTDAVHFAADDLPIIDIGDGSKLKVLIE
jgi:hypothetical protein